LKEFGSSAGLQHAEQQQVDDDGLAQIHAPADGDRLWHDR
jgi:hypothetical protein